MDLFDRVLQATETSINGGATVVSENHNLSDINWVRGVSDPGEMIACGAYPELRRHAGESDEDYFARLQTMEIPVKVQQAMIQAASRRASLSQTNGRVEMMSAGKLPWHGLGVQIDQACNSAQAISFAGLDWEVVKVPMSYEFDGETHESTDTYAILRADTGKKLGTVGSRYAPIQNKDGFSFLDDVLDEFGARYETAGAIYGGRRVWMLAHLPEQAFTVNGDDKVEPFVIFSNCHDGSGAAWTYPTSVRVECANTHRIAHGEGRRNKRGLSIRHTGSVRSKVDDARNALGFAVRGFEDTAKSYQAMGAAQVEVRHYANDVLDAVLDVTAAEALKGADALAAALQVTEATRELKAKEFQRKIERRGEILNDIIECYESERNAKAGRGSVWSAFNAVTDFADHQGLAKNTRGDSDTKASRRFESVLDGPDDSLKQEAYQQALALV